MIRLIVAQGDVLASADPRQLEADSVPALGDSIYEAGLALRALMEQVGKQAMQGEQAGVPTSRARNVDCDGSTSANRPRSSG